MDEKKLHPLVKRYAHEGFNIPKYILLFLPFYENTVRYGGYTLGDYHSTWERLKKRVALRGGAKISISSPYKLVPSLWWWAKQRGYPRSTTYCANKRLAKAGMVIKTEQKISIKIKLEEGEWKIYRSYALWRLRRSGYLFVKNVHSALQQTSREIEEEGLG